MDEKMYRIENDTFSLSSATEESQTYLEKSKEAAEQMKQLKKDIETHEKKKKQLDLQIERTRAAYGEYVQSIEALESSEMYKRVSLGRALKHTALMKHGQVFSVPRIGGETTLSKSICEEIDEALGEYKKMRTISEGLAQLEKEATAAGESTAEIEKKFAIYEKKVSFSLSKMNFSLLVNKISLRLMAGILKEIEETRRISEKHIEACSDMSRVVMDEARTFAAKESSTVSKELSDLVEISKEEVERQRRRISEEYRPVREDLQLYPSPPTVLRRVIPRYVGFLVSNPKQETRTMFASKFRTGERALRGSFYLYKDILVVSEAVFGLKLYVPKKDVYYVKTSEEGVVMEYGTETIEIFCGREERRALNVWARRGFCESEREVRVAETSSSVDEVFRAVFEEPLGKSGAGDGGEVEEEVLMRENEAKQRRVARVMAFGGVEVRSVCHETQAVEQRTKEEAVIAVYSKIEICAGFPVVSGVSDIRVVQDGKKTRILYRLKKNTTCWMLRAFSGAVLKKMVISMYLLRLEKAENVTVCWSPGRVEKALFATMVLGVFIVMFIVKFVTKICRNFL